MTDLKNLTAEELVRECALTSTQDAEILRRLRRLEKCETALPKLQAAINAVKRHVVTEDILWLLDAVRAALEE